MPKEGSPGGVGPGRSVKNAVTVIMKRMERYLEKRILRLSVLRFPAVVPGRGIVYGICGAYGEPCQKSYKEICGQGIHEKGLWIESSGSRPAGRLFRFTRLATPNQNRRKNI